MPPVPPMAVRIERVRADQWPMLREVRLAALADAPEAFGQRLEDAATQAEDEWMAAARAASEGDRRCWFIAWRDDRPVGVVQGRRRPPHDCLLFSMWVDPQSRRAGHGRALVDAIEGWAAGWGGRRIVLWVIAGNEPALRFYRRLGFSVVAHGPDAESGQAYGALAMQRRVRSTGSASEDVG